MSCARGWRKRRGEAGRRGRRRNSPADGGPGICSTSTSPFPRHDTLFPMHIRSRSTDYVGSRLWLRTVSRYIIARCERPPSSMKRNSIPSLYRVNGSVIERSLRSEMWTSQDTVTSIRRRRSIRVRAIAFQTRRRGLLCPSVSLEQLL